MNCLLVCLLDFFPHFLPSLFSSLLMVSFLLIYFLTRLLLDLSNYSFQNRPVSFQDLASCFLCYFYVVVYFVTDACLLLVS